MLISHHSTSLRGVCGRAPTLEIYSNSRNKREREHTQHETHKRMKPLSANLYAVSKWSNFSGDRWDHLCVCQCSDSVSVPLSLSPKNRDFPRSLPLFISPLSLSLLLPLSLTHFPSLSIISCRLIFFHLLSSPTC